MKVLVIGAAGRTGRHAVRMLLERGDNVTAFVRNPSAITERSDRLRVFHGGRAGLGCYRSRSSIAGRRTVGTRRRSAAEKRFAGSVYAESRHSDDGAWRKAAGESFGMGFWWSIGPTCESVRTVLLPADHLASCFGYTHFANKHALLASGIDHMLQAFPARQPPTNPGPFNDLFLSLVGPAIEAAGRG